MYWSLSWLVGICAGAVLYYILRAAVDLHLFNEICDM